MEVGIDSFASVGTSEKGETTDAAQSVAELLERIEQADRSGLDIFGIGEHHRHEFLDSANAVILAAVAARTERIGKRGYSRRCRGTHRAHPSNQRGYGAERG
ncbi:LLM class flavin-dependent oxidoreductase [Oscillatoria nigro-viridis]|uniref:LLM class flavin-dependent oxidoreductase n=1 Tax=Phormidium nigroviride TaxID=482564 RepID=UPI0026BF0D9E